MLNYSLIKTMKLVIRPTNFINNEINLSEMNLYYTKLQSDALLNNKLNSSEMIYYTK